MASSKNNKEKKTPEISQVALLSGTGTVSSAFPEGKKDLKKQMNKK